MSSGRYQPPITFLSSLFIVLLLSTSAGSADDWECPVCTHNATQALANLNDQTKEERYDTFCQMHYEGPLAAISRNEEETRRERCANILGLVKKHLQAIADGGTSFINVKLLDAINSRVAFGNAVASDPPTTRTAFFPDKKAIKEFKAFSHELKQLTNANWLVLLSTNEEQLCPNNPIPFNPERRLKNQVMEDYRLRIYEKKGCDTITITALTQENVPSNNKLVFAGLPPPISKAYLEKLSETLNKKIITLLTTKNIEPGSTESLEINLEILRFGKKVFYTHRYNNGNTRTSLFSINILRLATGFPPYQQRSLIALDSGTPAALILMDQIKKESPKKSSQEDHSSYLRDIWNRIYRVVFPFSGRES